MTITIIVQSEPIPLELTASDHRGDIVEGGNFAGKGTTYVTQEQIYRGFSSMDTTLAYLGAGGGTPEYSYAIISAHPKVTIQENIIILAQGFVFQPGQTRLQITVQVTDKNRPTPNTARLTLRFIISSVIQHPHLNGFVLPVISTLINNFDDRVNIFRQAAASPETLTAIVVNVHDRTAIRKIGGNLDFEKRITSTHPGVLPYSNQYNILFRKIQPQLENTLSIVLRVTDGDGLTRGGNPQSRRARPDRIHTIYIKYVRDQKVSFMNFKNLLFDQTVSVDKKENFVTQLTSINFRACLGELAVVLYCPPRGAGGTIQKAAPALTAYTPSSPGTGAYPSPRINSIS